MSNKSYVDLYEVLDVFEDNSYQKIMMGSPYDNPEEIVIINNLKRNNPMADKIFESAKRTLKNILHTEVLADSLILVTEYEEGLPIKDYLKTVNDDNKRYNLAKNYLRKISIYETFNSYMQTIFVDQNQIIMKDNKLIMNGLMILDDQMNFELPFAATKEKIHEALQTIFYDGSPSFEENENKRISAFLATLTPKSNDYRSISDIIISFEKAFIRNNTNDNVIPMPIKKESDNKPAESTNESTDSTKKEDKLDLSAALMADSKTEVEPPKPEPKQKQAQEKQIMLDGLTVVNELPEEEKKKSDKKPLILLILLIVLLGAVIYTAYNHFFKPEPDMLPTASFTRTVHDDKQFFKNTSVAYGKNNDLVESQWTVYAMSDDGTQRELKTYNKLDLTLFIKNEGTYKTELKVKDSKGQWSAVASEEFELASNNINTPIQEEEPVPEGEPIPDSLDNMNIGFDTDNISSEEEMYRSGSKSIKFDLTNGSGAITLNGLDIKSGSILSAWILADNTEPVIINITGYSGGTKVFTNKQKHVFRATNTWEMFEMKLSKKHADKLIINISGNGQLWIDDIDINSYK